MQLTRQLKQLIHCPCEFASRVGFWIEDSKDDARVAVRCNNCCRTGSSVAVNDDIETARELAMTYWNRMIGRVSRKAA